MEQNLYAQYDQYLPMLKLSKGTELVLHQTLGRFFVKKEITAGQLAVYQFLQQRKHPNLPRVYALMQSGTGYIVFEQYIAGETLAQRLGRDGPLPEHQAADYGVQLCAALEEIHGAGIVHRDIKPANIIISDDGVLKLIDFGIARTQKPNSSQDTTILGTAGYAAPEQFGFSQSDAGTDFYAVGVLLNVMCTCRLPGEQRPGGKINSIIEKCIEIDPKKRFQNADQLRRRLLPIAKTAIPQTTGMKYGFPGFRNHSNVIKLLAVFWYICMAILGIVFLFGAVDYAIPMRFVHLLLAVLLPYVMVANPGYVFDRIFRKWSPSARLLLRSLVSVASIIGWIALLQS